MTENGVNRIAVDGAQLRYLVRGGGPLLMLLGSGDADAEGNESLVEHLADHFTVVTYDRRGLSESSLDVPVENLRLERHSNDVHQLLRHLTNEPVIVVGSSIGGLIGLDLIANHPEQIRCLVAHEPPAPELLNEPERSDAVRDQIAIEEAYRSAGIPAAMRRFVEVARIKFEDREADARLPAPSPERAKNLQFFLTYDAPAARRYRLNIDALSLQASKIIPAAGEASIDAWPNRCATALATRLDRTLVRFPGGHAGFASHPRSFAKRLREVVAMSETLNAQ